MISKQAAALLLCAKAQGTAKYFDEDAVDFTDKPFDWRTTKNNMLQRLQAKSLILKLPAKGWWSLTDKGKREVETIKNLIKE